MITNWIKKQLNTRGNFVLVTYNDKETAILQYEVKEKNDDLFLEVDFSSTTLFKECDYIIVHSLEFFDNNNECFFKYDHEYDRRYNVCDGDMMHITIRMNYNQ